MSRQNHEAVTIPRGLHWVDDAEVERDLSVNCSAPQSRLEDLAKASGARTVQVQESLNAMGFRRLTGCG